MSRTLLETKNYYLGRMERDFSQGSKGEWL